VPRVFIPTLLKHLTDGRADLEVEGATIRQLIANIDAQYPGFAARLLDQDRLRLNVSVAIDGEISPLGLLETVTPSSEVHFIAAIRGGAPTQTC